MTSESILEAGMTPLERARAIQAAKRAAGIKTVVLDPISKARANPTSLRMAINGKCWDCMGAGADPNTRLAISECGIESCTLWPVRPYRKSDDDVADEEVCGE
jgi:hypothetical protein